MIMRAMILSYDNGTDEYHKTVTLVSDCDDIFPSDEKWVKVEWGLQTGGTLGKNIQLVSKILNSE